MDTGEAVCECCNQAIVENMNTVYDTIVNSTWFGSKVDRCFDPLAKLGMQFVSYTSSKNPRGFVASIAWRPMDLRDYRWTGEMVLVVTVKMIASSKNPQG